VKGRTGAPESHLRRCAGPRADAAHRVNRRCWWRSESSLKLCCSPACCLLRSPARTVPGTHSHALWDSFCTSIAHSSAINIEMDDHSLLKRRADELVALFAIFGTELHAEVNGRDWGQCEGYIWQGRDSWSQACS